MGGPDGCPYGGFLAKKTPAQAEVSMESSEGETPIGYRE